MSYPSCNLSLMLLIPHVSQHLLRTLLIHAVQLTVVFAPLYRPITPLANVAEILSCNMSYPSCNLSLMLLIPHLSQHLLNTLLIHAVQPTFVFAPLCILYHSSSQCCRNSFLVDHSITSLAFCQILFFRST